jgi:glycosyltransferase involved in cell wall biosynthesis
MEFERSAEASPKLPRLLYVVSEDWYFLSHRLPMARAARDSGFEVHVATKINDGAAAIKAEGFTVHGIPFKRGRLSVPSSLATIRALRRLYRELAPTIVHHVALQCSVLGLIAAIGRPTACVNAITGFGYAFTSASFKARLIASMTQLVLRILLNRPEIVTLVQNADDRDALLQLGVPSSRIALIRGSGVDVNRLVPLPEPAGRISAAFVGRLLVDKGVRTLIAAHRILRARGSDLEILLAGTPDPANPASIGEQEIAAWSKEPGVTWLGQVEDIAAVWRRAHFAVLPSRREGLPLSLLEAASCQRAMIGSDVPGCREIVVHEQSGLLVPVDDATALADAMAKLAGAPDLRARYAAEARRMVVANFAADIIGRQTVELYRQLLTVKSQLTKASTH